MHSIAKNDHCFAKSRACLLNSAVRWACNGVCAFVSNGYVLLALHVHSIDYGAFLRAQAAPVAAAAFHRVEEQQEQLVAALSSADVGGSGQPISMAEEVAPVKIDAGQQRPKIDGAAAERKPKIGGAAASKGGSQKRNK